MHHVIGYLNPEGDPKVQAVEIDDEGAPTGNELLEDNLKVSGYLTTNHKNQIILVKSLGQKPDEHGKTNPESKSED